MSLPSSPGSIAASAQEQDIWDLLSALRVLRAHLWLGAIGRPPLGVSIVLAVQPAEGWALIDALRDDDQLRADDRLYFDTQVEGRRLRMECRLLRTVALDEGPAYVIGDLRIVLDQQRRNAYRVRLPQKSRIPAAIIDVDGVPVPARVLDISQIGCCAHVQGELAATPGTPVRLRVGLPEFDLAAEAEVRHLVPGPTGLRVGMMFTIRDTASQERLAQSVSRLQRQVLRERQS